MPKIYKLGKGTANIITKFETKKEILDYLFSSIEISKYRFQMLQNKEQLETIKENEYNVSPNFQGNNYFLILMKLKNNRKSFLVDRRKLKYNIENVDLKQALILEIEIKGEEELFNGTIIDGKLLLSDENKIFICNDIYLYNNKDINNLTLKEKYKKLDLILKTQMEKDCCYNFSIKINKLYDIIDLKDLVENKIPKAKLPINGLVFYPKYSGIIFIHSEKKSERRIEKCERVDSVRDSEIKFKKVNVEDDETYHIIRDLPKYLESRTLLTKDDLKDKKTGEFYLRKSDIADVYHILEIKSLKQIGIAHIPNMTLSLKLDEIFTKNSQIKMECYYHNIFKKWVPIISNNK